MAARSYKTASGRTLGESVGRYGERAFEAFGRGMYIEAQAILQESLPLVPVDTGALRGSGYVTEPERKGDHITVEIGYGGVAAQINPKTLESTGVYAMTVHENLEAHHPVGQAKYLQMPFDAATNGMGDRIGATMRAEMSGAGKEPSDASGGTGEPE